VKQAAIDALGRLYFNHAFDPLVRIFREHSDPVVRSTALQSIGRIPSLEAGDFLVEVLRYEDGPMRTEAKRLLARFENREIIPILRQHQSMESGPMRAELDQILRQLGGQP
jgi:HEAT repeat protein